MARGLVIQVIDAEGWFEEAVMIMSDDGKGRGNG